MNKTKPKLSSAFKYLALALPLLFIAPIMITVGFKAIKKDNSFLFLIIGIILALLAMIITAVGIIKIARYLFDKNDE
jgi:membrane protein YdbS with pleckstrin-like domain